MGVADILRSVSVVICYDRKMTGWSLTVIKQETRFVFIKLSSCV